MQELSQNNILNKTALIRMVGMIGRRSLKFGEESLLLKKKVESMNLANRDKVINIKNLEDAQHIVKYVSEKDFSKRNLQHLKKALEHVQFLEEITENLSEDFFFNLLREFNHKSYSKGSFIYQYEDYDPRFYIIISGNVICLTPRRFEENFESNSYITEPPFFLLEKSLSIPEPDKSKTEQRESTFNNKSRESRMLSIKGIRTYDKKSFSENLENNYWKKGNFISPRRKRTLMQSQYRPERLSSSPLRRLKAIYERSSSIKGKYSRLSSKGSSDDIYNCRDVDKILSFLPNFKTSKNLEAGDWFGEAVLLTNARRDCSMLCKEDTELMFLSKSSYDKLMGEYNSKIISKKIAFLKNFTMFKNLTENRIYSIYEKMKKLDMKRNDVVYKEGDLSEKIYFIKKGEVELSKITTKEKDKSEFDNYFKKDFPRSKEFFGVNQVWEDAKWRENVKRIKIALLGQGCCFGEEELLINVPRYTKAVITSGVNEIYYLTKKKFNSFFRSQAYIYEMMKELKSKNEWRGDYINSVVNFVHDLESDPSKLGLVFINTQNTKNISDSGEQNIKRIEGSGVIMDESDRRFFNRERISNVNKAPLKRGNNQIMNEEAQNLFKLYYTKVLNEESLKNWRKTPLFDTSSISRSNVNYKLMHEGRKIKVFYKYCPEKNDYVKRRYNFFSSHKEIEEQSNKNFHGRSKSLNHGEDASSVESKGFEFNTNNEPPPSTGFKDQINEERWELSRKKVWELKNLIQKGKLQELKCHKDDYLFREEEKIDESLKQIPEKNILLKLRMGFERREDEPEQNSSVLNKKNLIKNKHTYLHTRGKSAESKEYIKKNKFLNSLQKMYQNQQPRPNSQE